MLREWTGRGATRMARYLAAVGRNVWRAVLLGCIATVGLAGCVSRGGPVPYDPPGFGTPDPAATGVLDGGLPVGPLDELKVTVFRVPDLSGTYIVGADGVVELPLIGKIAAANHSTEDLARQIESLYGARYLQNPDVTVQTVTSNQRLITVEGGVGVPGNYPLNGKSNLLAAIAAARGIDPQNGNPRRVVVFRRIEGRMNAAAFDLVDVRRGTMANPDIYPGDIVVVDGNSVRSIYRDIIQTLPILALFNPF